MKKLLLFACLICAVHTGFAQHANITPTSSFSIEGDIKNKMVISPKELSTFEQKEVGDIPIKNHQEEIKHTVTKVKGVLLKDVLKQIVLNTANPKLFNAYYITCVASDDYKVVYSWNELFNSPTGDNTYILTSRDGQSISQMDDHIAIITSTDFHQGSRYLRALSKIIISRVP